MNYKRLKTIAKMNGWGNEDNLLDFIATLSQQGNKGTTHITHISKKEVPLAIELGNKILNELGLEIEIGQVSERIY